MGLADADEEATADPPLAAPPTLLMACWAAPSSALETAAGVLAWPPLLPLLALPVPAAVALLLLLLLAVVALLLLLSALMAAGVATTEEATEVVAVDCPRSLC